ncbi:MAG: asparagine synthase (glutamine-hydrolyzing) [Gammaproteobacteria bacterium]|jgi:asparagine synthase (glutamine-hydrolysing)
MCGFAGVLKSSKQKISDGLIQSMGNIIAHRGPDDRGEVFINTDTGQSKTSSVDNSFCANLGFAFRRLSILDLSHAGHQPMCNNDQSIWLVFNGEIYNYRELQQQLIGKGRRFISHTDTEIILALYEEYGEEAFKKLNGMFAIALWDQRKKSLFLVRDRFGIKPLYYSFVGSSLIFGSEIKSLLLCPGVKRGIDPLGTIEHFNFQFCLQEKTIFNGINALESGSFLVFNVENPSWIKKRVKYWDICYEPDYNKTVENFADDLRFSLKKAINRQTVSDVSVGAFLSSGMDSGSVCALAKPTISNLNTFTCGFNVKNMHGLEVYFDERLEARNLAKQLGTRHHEIEVKNYHLAKLLPSVVWHIEDPRVGISYQNYALAKKIKEHVTVVLSGTGGDELFGGYPWRYKQILDISNIDAFDTCYYRIWSRLLNDDVRWNVFSEKMKKEASDFSPETSYRKVMQNCLTDNALNRALYFDMKGFLQGLLSVEDKLNMAFSVESRVPFLDNEVVDLVLKMPAEMKYDGITPKLVLKKALRGILDDEVLYRRKQGFTPPDASWFRNFSRPYIESVLLSERFFDRGWFRREAINNILMQHFSGEENNRFLIWSLLCFEMLHRQFLDVDVPTPLSE